MKRTEDVVALIDFTLFPGWRLAVADDNGRTYLQVRAVSTCNDTGAPLQWSGRKWHLSPHMTTTEIVNTAFKAFQAAVDHELRESFLYRGVRIYDPHTDVEALFHLQKTATPDVRATP
jgi:hypothetical protein